MYEVNKHSGRRGAGLIARVAQILVLFIALLALWVTDAAARQLGFGRETVEIQGETIDVFTYHPIGCAQPSLLFVFHGNGRGAISYRESAQHFADRACFIIIVPLFDRDRFPGWSYHRGGMVQDGEFVPRDEWTVNMVARLVDWAREREERPDAPYYLFGHSAGGQFLSRVAAFAMPNNPRRVIIANPSTHVLPSLEEAIPYGFGDLPKDMNGSALLREYLAAPITIYVGREDTGDKDLTVNEPAMRQGENRLERAKSVFELGRRLAEANGWTFGWELVFAEGIGHTARGMLNAGEMYLALGFPIPELTP